mmetsp:Transcript_123871/g.246506  ORF Transcript_123871/g.246506 Transcript_123871/m.246506 type:complete len:275 (-) Transcript_123871:475-1299(-)
MAMRMRHPFPRRSTLCARYCGMRMTAKAWSPPARLWNLSKMLASSSACCRSGCVWQLMSLSATSRRSFPPLMISPAQTSLKEPRPRTPEQRNRKWPITASVPGAYFSGSPSMLSCGRGEKQDNNAAGAAWAAATNLGGGAAVAVAPASWQSRGPELGTLGLHSPLALPAVVTPLAPPALEVPVGLVGGGAHDTTGANPWPAAAGRVPALCTAQGNCCLLVAPCGVVEMGATVAATVGSGANDLPLRATSVYVVLADLECSLSRCIVAPLVLSSD